MTNFRKTCKHHELILNPPPTYGSIQLADGGVFVIWKRIFRINAQTHYDMDFGDRWNGDWLEHEGNKYGDTSGFYVIGSLKYPTYAAYQHAWFIP